MPTFVFNDAQKESQSLGPNESGFVGPMGTLLVEGTDAAISTVGRASLTVLGTVYTSGNNMAIRAGQVTDQTASLALSIGKDGYVGSSNGIAINTLLTSGFFLNNAGSIVANYGTAVQTSWATAFGRAFVEIENSGNIYGNATALALGTGSSSASLVNSGEIASPNAAISFSGDGSKLVTNSGLISGRIVGSTNGDGPITLENSGKIAGFISLETLDDTLTNTGEVFANVFMNDGRDIVTNTGTITGRLDLGGGPDQYRGWGGGYIDGDVLGGEGPDTFFVDQPGLRVFGGTGEDSVETTIDWSIADDIENLRLRGAEDVNGYGNGADNEISGTAGNNLLAGFGGADFLVGRGGNDTLLGGFSNDDLRPGSGDDLVLAGTGDDFIIADIGNDTIDGGLGFDFVTYGNLSAGIVLEGDRVTLLGDTQVLSSIEKIDGTVAADSFFGDGSAQELDGNGGVDTIFGGSGNDTILGGTNGDQLFGGFGFDTLSYADSGAGVNVNLLAGTASGGDSTGDTFDSFEHLTGSGNGDTLAGGEFSNILTGLGGADVIGGRNGNDTILGGDGDDRLFGENGNDRFEGGDGNDTMIGGTGEDVFLFRPTHDGDTIRFWDGSEDFIRFVGFGYANAAAAYADFSQNGADAVWQNGTDSITLEGVTLNVDISVSDIIV